MSDEDEERTVVGQQPIATRVALLEHRVRELEWAHRGLGKALEGVKDSTTALKDELRKEIAAEATKTRTDLEELQKHFDGRFGIIDGKLTRILLAVTAAAGAGSAAVTGLAQVLLP